jgi:single-strand DNA-binding protein
MRDVTMLGTVGKGKLDADGKTVRFKLTADASYRTESGEEKEQSNWAFIVSEAGTVPPEGATVLVSGPVKSRRWVKKGTQIETVIQEVQAHKLLIFSSDPTAADGGSVGFNRIIVNGRLGADPEMRFLASGQGVTEMRVATGGKFTARDGTEVDNTEWIGVKVWGKLAEVANQYLQKGSEVTVTGRVDTREWKDKEDNTRWSLEVVAQDVQFGARAKGDGDSGGKVIGKPAGGKPTSKGAPPAIDADDDSDLPF